jgi:hypothetical protein
MSIRVQKLLGNSLFQFSVGRRREFRSIDNDRELSTGPAGEFIRHRPEIFYTADIQAIRSPEIPKPRSLSGTSFVSSLTDGTTGGKGRMVMIGIGVLLLLWGMAVKSQNPEAPAWILFLVGLVLIAIPIVRVATQRQAIKQHEARIRREREERDAHNAELLGAYTTSLEALRENPTDETLARVLRENEKLDLPYSIWADTAIGTVLYVGFSTLAKVGHDRASEVAALMDRSSDAAGLIAEDAKAVKHALYSTILWHFLADDRLGQEQLKIVRAVQQGFGITNDDVPNDASAESQFERLRGIDHRNAPRCEIDIPLGMNEYCMYSAQINPVEGAETTTFVTNRRVIIGSDNKKIEVTVPAIDDVVVDADSNRVTLRASTLKRPYEFRAAEPIFLAAMIDLATRLDDRPKSFT